MDVGVPRETGDTRVAATPKTVTQLRKLGYRVFIETGAGAEAAFSDEAYAEAGAEIVSTAWDKDIVLSVGPPSDSQLLEMRPGATVISFLNPRQDPGLTKCLAAQGLNALSMDMVPRTSRAQALDALSSLANISGYRAVRPHMPSGGSSRDR